MAKGTKAQAQEGGNLFSRIYHNGKDAIKAESESLVERSMKRKLQSAYDDAAGRINDIQQQITSEYEKLGGLNINNVIEYRADIAALKQGMEYTAETYLELFGEELNA